MDFSALHRLRRRSRGIAAATVAVFVLNWLGLALVPCAMALALPAVAQAAADVAVPAADVAAMPPDCHAHGASSAAHDAPQSTATTKSTGAHGSCPWCLERAPSQSGVPHDADCSATAKPALDSRDVAKGFQSPLLLALSATVLAIVPFDAFASAAPAVEPVLPPEAPASDRYCRRLE